MGPGRRSYRKCLVALVLLFWLLAGSATKAAAVLPGQVVVVLVDTLDVSEIKTMPNLRQMALQGGTGLMNARTAGNYTPANAYATAGAGAPAVGPGADTGFQVDEVVGGLPAGLRYQGRMGLVADGQLVLLDLPRLQSENLEKQGTPGSLGGILRQHGLQTAVIGNADLPGPDGGRRRWAVAMAMDLQGVVDAGRVDASLLDEEPAGALPLVTNYQALAEQWQAVRRQSHLVVLDLGDLARLETLMDQLAPAVSARERQQVLARVDSFLGDLMTSLEGQRTLVMVVSLYPGAAAQSDKRLLTPLVMAGSGVTPGILTSSTTRRPGLAAITDLAPTILRFFELPPAASMTGRPITSITWPMLPLLAQLEAEGQRAADVYQWRPQIIRGYVLAQILLVSLVTLALLLRSPRRRVLQPWLLASMAVPLGLLLLPLGQPATLAGYILWLLVIAAVIGWGSLVITRRWHPLLPLLLLALATVAAIVLDLVLGAELMRQSVLGYDSIAGARYYGIGNEYMGVLWGAWVVAAALLYQLWPQRAQLVAGLGMAVTLLLVASPAYGSNLGGAITGAVALVITWQRLGGKPLQLITIIWMTLLPLVVAAGAMLWDSWQPVAQRSHLGTAMNRVNTSGLQALVDVGWRKLEMNLKLIRYTIWTRVMLAFILTLGVLIYRPVGVMRSFQQRYARLVACLSGVLVVSGVALAANDSGIIAAATAMIHASTTVMYLLLNEV